MSLITSVCSRCGTQHSSPFMNRLLRDKPHTWTHRSCFTLVSFVKCLLWWHYGDWLVSMSTTERIAVTSVTLNGDSNKLYNCSNPIFASHVYLNRIHSLVVVLTFLTFKTHRLCQGPPCSQWTRPHFHFHCTCWESAGDWLLKCPAGPPACSSGGTNHRSSEPPRDPGWPDECALYLWGGWKSRHRTDEEKRTGRREVNKRKRKGEGQRWTGRVRSGVL